MPTQKERLARVLVLVDAARRIAAPNTALGARARRVLVASTGLSAEGVDLALSEALEHGPSEAEIEQLICGVAPAPAAHVLLSANVFTAALRALALALAASKDVALRPSRRDPAFAHLVHEQVPQLFTLVTELNPRSGDHVWAYGTDATLAEVRRTLAQGVVFHAHGTGFGAALLVSGDPLAPPDLASLADLLAKDICLFDQRGCLSPRVALISGRYALAEAFAAELAQALANWQHRVPRGELSAPEHSEITRYRDTLAYAGTLFEAGPGWVTVGPLGGPWVLAPPGRNLHVVPVVDPSAALLALGAGLTSVGVAFRGALRIELGLLRSRVRLTEFGKMQRPRFDGPVDLRATAAGQLL